MTTTILMLLLAGVGGAILSLLFPFPLNTVLCVVWGAGVGVIFSESGEPK